MKPFFSILTITKNTDFKVNKTIQSILNQSCRDYEYIFLDGYSRDNTYKIISKYKSKKIKKLRFKDKNFYDGLNQAIKFSSGRYICVLNSGDIFYNKKTLEVIKNKISNTGFFDAYYGNLVYFTKNKPCIRVWKKKIDNNHNISECFKIPHPSIFLAKDFINLYKFSYNINYQISSDFDYIVKLIKKNCKFYYLNIFVTRMEYGGLSTKLEFLFKKIVEDIKICQKYFGKYYLIFYIKKIFIKISMFKIKKIFK